RFREGRENPGTIETTCQTKPDHEIASPFSQSPIRGVLFPSGKICANCFTRDNIHKVNADDVENPTINLLSLSLSGGGLRLPLIEAEVNKEKRLVTFRWKQQPLMPFMAKEDRLMGVIHEREERKADSWNSELEAQAGRRMAVTGRWNVNQLVARFRCQRNGQNIGTLGLLETNGTPDHESISRFVKSPVISISVPDIQKGKTGFRAPFSIIPQRTIILHTFAQRLQLA
ncbi:MAG: hypothetical protein ACLUDU_11290, partial [Butyricimonas faecihominis]